MLQEPDLIKVIILKAPLNNIEFQKLLKEIFLINDEKILKIKKDIKTPIGEYPVDIALTRGNALYSACEQHKISIELDYCVD